MDYQSLHNMTVVELRKLAKERQVKLPAGMKKEAIIQELLGGAARGLEGSAAEAPVARAAHVRESAGERPSLRREAQSRQMRWKAASRRKPQVRRKRRQSPVPMPAKGFRGAAVRLRPNCRVRERGRRPMGRMKVPRLMRIRLRPVGRRPGRSAAGRRRMQKWFLSARKINVLRGTRLRPAGRMAHRMLTQAGRFRRAKRLERKPV